jgi:hypothetical protein
MVLGVGVVGGTVVCGVVGGLVVAVTAVWCHEGSQVLIQICPWNPCSGACGACTVRQNCTENNFKVILTSKLNSRIPLPMCYFSTN